MGNFFIGISPILAGGGVILLMVRLLTPEMFFAMKLETAEIRATFIGGFDGDAMASLFGGIGSMLGSFFALGNFLNWRWWICMLLSFSIAIHMEVSRSDIVSGLRGFGVISAMLLIADVILGLLFPNALSAVTSACVTAGIFIAFIMLIPAVFSLLIGVVSLMVIFVRESAKSIQNDRAQPVANHRNLPANRPTDTKSKK